MKPTTLLLLAVSQAVFIAACGGSVADGTLTSGGAGGAAGSSAGGSSAGTTSGGSTSSAAGTTASGGAGAIGSGGTAPNGGTTGASCGETWVSGKTYVAGDIVYYEADGGWYIAENENPGYEPNVSTWFWEPYVCEGGGGGGGTSAGGTGNTGQSGFAELVSESTFNDMFPDRNPFYTYQGLVEATLEYPAFANTGSLETRKREAAAFLANVARETGLLIYIDQIAKDDYCAWSDGCPCEGGKQYYGRGPIQISWNYNYCSAGDELGYDLRAQPELVSQNATIAWATGLWFWMTQQGAGTYTPHDAMVEDRGFGETIRSINGSIECGTGGNEAVTARKNFYTGFCSTLGVSPGDNLEC